MDETQWTLVTIIGASLLGLVLLWAVLKTRKVTKDPGTNERAERATHELYQEEERRRREGTDGM